MPRPRRSLRAAEEASTSPPASLPNNHSIMRVTRPAGNNLLHAETATGEAALVELPGKLRGTIWVRRGGFVLVDTDALAARGNKLAGEVCAVVMRVREWRRMDYWPAVWQDTGAGADANDDEDNDDDDDDNKDSRQRKVRPGDMPPSDSEGEEDA